MNMKFLISLIAVTAICGWFCNGLVIRATSERDGTKIDVEELKAYINEVKSDPKAFRFEGKVDVRSELIALLDYSIDTMVRVTSEAHQLITEVEKMIVLGEQKISDILNEYAIPIDKQVAEHRATLEDMQSQIEAIPKSHYSDVDRCIELGKEPAIDTVRKAEAKVKTSEEGVNVARIHLDGAINGLAEFKKSFASESGKQMKELENSLNDMSRGIYEKIQQFLTYATNRVQDISGKDNEDQWFQNLNSELHGFIEAGENECRKAFQFVDDELINAKKSITEGFTEMVGGLKMLEEHYKKMLTELISLIRMDKMMLPAELQELHKMAAVTVTKLEGEKEVPVNADDHVPCIVASKGEQIRSFSMHNQDVTIDWVGVDGNGGPYKRQFARKQMEENQVEVTETIEHTKTHSKTVEKYVFTN